MTDMNGKSTANKEDANKQNDAENSRHDNNPRIYEDYNINSAPKADSAAGDVNMEAIITADDIARAGGFGARDDIGSLLPVASDSTDFEALLIEAQGFEEPQGEKKRPGLGWTEAMEK